MPQSPRHSLVPEEVDFKKLPRSEYRACLFFEVARDFPSLLSCIKVWRQCGRKLLSYPFGANWEAKREWEEKYLPELKAKFSGQDLERFWLFFDTGLRVALISSEFPKVPWQKLSAAERRKGIAMVPKGSLFLAQRDPKALRYLAVADFPIESWILTNPQLIEKFRAWLKPNRPISPKTKTGPDPDQFKQIAALRILEFEATEKKRGKLHTTDWFAAILPEDDRNLRKAAKIMRDFLQEEEASLVRRVQKGNPALLEP
jgi:hypothetical protein